MAKCFIISDDPFMSRIVELKYNGTHFPLFNAQFCKFTAVVSVRYSTSVMYSKRKVPFSASCPRTKSQFGLI